MEYEDGASYQERVARAIQKSRPCFTDDAFYRVAAAYPIYGTSYIINSILDNQLALRTENPRSFEGFRANVGKLFDAQFLSHLEQKSKAFDVLCGKPHADALWGKMTYLQWAELIADNCIMCNMAPLPREDASQHQSNGASNPPSSSTTISAHGGAQPAPITQVNLRGATLKEAWEGSSQANLISAFEQPNNWTPSEPTDVEVFWGTSTHLKDREREEDMDKVLGTHPITLGRRPGLTQLHPHHNLCAGILTTFSAFERFLWPVFLTEVIDDPPGPSPSGKLAQSFQMRGRSYKGVLLVRFRPPRSAPNCQPLNAYVIPEGQEEAWQSIARNSNSPGCRNFWERVNHIHGQATPHQPDVIHGKLMPALCDSLAAFTGDTQLFWQTAWMSDNAAGTLLASAQELYAISFELVSHPKQADQPVPLRKRQRISAFIHKTRNSIKKILF